MRIAIIGSGIYGCFLSIKLKQEFNSDITIYEKNSDIMCGAIMNNQHRLHQGYHYPRSLETINECINSYDDFITDFGDCVKNIENNYYLIHENSHINFDDYINLYSSLKLNFSEIDIEKFFLDEKKIIRDGITGIINVEEKAIQLDKLKTKIQYLLLTNKITTIFNTFIDEEYVNNLKKEYDYVINCSYNNFNLNIKNKKPIKHELCSLLLIDNYFDKNKSYTIMDGNFVSIYSNGYDKHTISSVKETPFFKFEDKDLQYYSNNIEKYFLSCDAKNKIFNDTNNYFIIDYSKINSHYLTVKTKELEDTNDKRETFLIKEENYISIFCGKISSIYVLWNKLKKEII